MSTLIRRLDHIQTVVESQLDGYVLDDGQKVYLPDRTAVRLFFEIFHADAEERPVEPELAQYIPTLARAQPRPNGGRLDATVLHWCREIVASGRATVVQPEESETAS